MTKIISLVQRLLPHGTRTNEVNRGCQSWSQIPIWPPNVFAVAARLVERSGAYRHVIGPDEAHGFTDDLGLFKDGWIGEMEKRARAWSWGLIHDRKKAGWAEIVSYCKARTSFDRALLDVSLDPLREDWHSLVETHGEAEILPRNMIVPGGSSGSLLLPQWWAPALRLLITADTASRGIGFMPWLTEHDDDDGKKVVREGEPNWVQWTVFQSIALRLKRARDTESEEEEGFPGAAKRAVASVASFFGRGVDSVDDLGYIYTVTDDLFNEALGAVLPKTRTSTLGCTLRSLSHHLAIVPPAGQVQARWRVSQVRPIEATKCAGQGGIEKPLNLLLVPFPYRISADCFSGTLLGEDDDENRWGYFHIEQRWLPAPEKKGDRRSRKDQLQELASFVANLVRTAANSSQEVNGVILPEFALDAESFNVISEKLREEADHTGFEFIVAGMSEEPLPSHRTEEPRRGNFAAFLGLTRSAADGKYAASVRGAREKHHRWKLNKTQINRYALSSYLDTKGNWWEGIPVSPRVVEFFEVRGGTSLTVLICEDLARSDPVQQVVRAIGPNLVIAILMDGPQRAFRWPAHYAGVLADDPGSSVLTLTSLGLIERSAATDPTQNRSVAFFKDSSGREKELPLPVDAHALLLSLETRAKAEHTLDGRSDGGVAFIWELSEVTPIRASANCVKDWILGLD